jgi:hypothetical protein
MKLGDLVDFHSRAWIFKHAETRYSNPGLVIKKNNDSAIVYWSDGRITTEHNTYLKLAAK